MTRCLTWAFLTLSIIIKSHPTKLFKFIHILVGFVSERKLITHIKIYEKRMHVLPTCYTNKISHREAYVTFSMSEHSGSYFHFLHLTPYNQCFMYTYMPYLYISSPYLFKMQLKSSCRYKPYSIWKQYIKHICKTNSRNIYFIQFCVSF